jgi:hypothetical protein
MVGNPLLKARAVGPSARRFNPQPATVQLAAHTRHMEPPAQRIPKFFGLN